MEKSRSNLSNRKSDKSSENSFIKRTSKKKVTEIKVNKRKSSIGYSKKNKLLSFRNRRGTLFSQHVIKPISITFQKFPQTIALIKYIKLYKEMNLKKKSELNENIMKKHLIDKIVALLKDHKGLFNFFSLYQITEKAILRLARGLHFIQKEKNDLIWYENDVSNKIYFLLKGKLSFIKYFETPHEREIYQINEDNVFGMDDILYDRKRKYSCLTLEECSYLCFSRDIFKLYMEENVNKVISERKRFLMDFFKDYLPLTSSKIERYISNSVENIFFRKNDIIYKEGDKNIYLYLLFKGEANLVVDINKNRFDILPNLSLPISKIKENAKNIEYGNIIDNCKIEMSQNNEETFDNKLDIKNYKVLCTLSKGIVGGMEISSGLLYFKYNLVCNSDFCAIIRVKLELFENDHLKTLMVNLLPDFISKEKKIYKLIQNIKNIDNLVNPPSCQKFKEIKDIPTIINTDYKPSKTEPTSSPKKEKMINFNFNNAFNNRNINTNMNLIPIKTENNLSSKNNEENVVPNLCISVNVNESDKAYHKIIKRIDDKFDTNEGGFIKLTNYNLNLLVQKHFLKSQLTNNKRLDFKIKNFIKKCEDKEKSNLKKSTVKMSYLLNEESFKNPGENTVFNMINFGFEIGPNGKRIKSGDKSKIKFWNFPYISTFTSKSKTFANFYTNNFKSRRAQRSLTRRKLRKEINDMMEKYEKAYAIKESTKNIRVKEIYDKLVSFKSLKKEQKEHANKNKINLQHRNFIKELIIMKKPLEEDEGTNIFGCENSFNPVNIKKKNKKRCETEVGKKNNFIKIINNKYLDDLFYHNFQNQKNSEIKNIRKNFFIDYYNKHQNYNKNRIILYDTGKFDMPLVTNITTSEK